VLTPSLLAILTGILMVIGVISGLLPAIKASRLDPMSRCGTSSAPARSRSL